jgi:hypothetical protein
MAKNVFKYCKKCKKRTEHLKEKTHSPGARVIIGIFTFGFNEIMVEDMYECTECGKRS